MIASFSSTSTALVTQLSNYFTQRAEILTRRSNLTPRRAKNTLNDLSVVSVVRKSLKASWLHSFSLFFPRSTSCSRQFTPNGCNFGKHFTAAKYTEKKKRSHEVGLDRYILAPSFTNRQNCSHTRAAKHKNLLSFSRVITKPFMTFMNTSTSN